MILLYLQTQAIKTGSREVELGRSMRDWLGRMGLSWGGETGRALREQATRISACSLKFFWEDGGADGFERGTIVRSGLRFHAEDSTQGSLWEDRGFCVSKTERQGTGNSAALEPREERYDQRREHQGRGVDG